MKTQDRVIPRAKMPEGINLCKANITNFLRDARLLIDNSILSHAYISVQFAIEELAKILIFRNKLKTDASDPLAIKKEEAFTHKCKTKKALEFLGKDFEKVFEGIWKEGIWKRGIWAENTYVGHKTRLGCAFVDFYNGNWQIGLSIKKESLIKLINRIEEKLPDA